MTAIWTGPKSWSTSELLTAALLNTHLRDNLDWLKTPSTSGKITFASDFTYAANVYTDITGVTSTFTSYGGGFDVYFRFTILVNTLNQSATFKLVVDGADEVILGSILMDTVSLRRPIQFHHHVSALTAGLHTFKVQMISTNSGVTWTIRGTTSGQGDPLFYVREEGN